jgi:hypothetical protein
MQEPRILSISNALPELEHLVPVRKQARLDLVRATLRHANNNTPYYRRAFAGLSLEIDGLEDIRRFPLLERKTLAACGTDLLAEGVVPEYVGITSGTTFGNSSWEPLLHYQTETEHDAWVNLYGSMIAKGDRPLMLRLIDADRGVEVAGASPGCFSLPMESLYHYELILSILKREWSFPGFATRVGSLSGPLDMLQVLTLLCLEHEVDPAQLSIGLVTTSGWQLTSRWRRLLESYWGAEVQELYGLSEVPGMFAARCSRCSHYHFSPLTVMEVLQLDGDNPVERGIGRVVVTALLPLAYAQPLIRYDTQEVIEIVGECGDHELCFEYLGRRSRLVLHDGPDGRDLMLSPPMLTEVLDSIPDVAIYENEKGKRLGVRIAFGWPRYMLRDESDEIGRRIDLTVELRWSPVHYPYAAERLRDLLLRRFFDASPALAGAVRRDAIRFVVRLAEPGTLNSGQPNR